MLSSIRITRTLLISSCVLLPLLYLAPVISSPLSSDDIINFYQRVSAKDYYQQSIPDIAKPTIEFLKHNGRYTPLSVYQLELVFKYFQTIRSYKIFLYVLNLLALLSFVFLLLSLGKKQLVPYLIVAYGALIQFRLQFHDPFTSLNGMYIFLAIFIFSGAALYVLYLRKGHPLFLALALFFFVLSFLTGEIGLTMIPVLIAMAFFYRANTKQVIVASVISMIIAAVYILYVIEVRRHVHTFYQGVETNFEVKAMMDVLSKQLFGALPFSNLHHQHNIPLILQLQLSVVNIVAMLMMVVLSLAIIWFKTPLSASADKAWELSPFVLGFILLIIPAVFLMPSVKYQQHLDYGFGYLPVYIQNFGSAVLLALLLHWIINRRGKLTLKILFSTAIVVATLSAFLFNQALSKCRGYKQSMPFEAQMHALQKGILSDVPENSIVLLADDYIWKAPGIYQTLFKNYSGKTFDVYNMEDYHVADNDSAADGYVLQTLRGDDVYVILYRIVNRANGKWNMLRSDTFHHDIRIARVEDPLIERAHRQ